MKDLLQWAEVHVAPHTSCLHTSMIRNSTWQSEHKFSNFERRGLLCLLGTPHGCVQGDSGVYLGSGTGGWVAATLLRAEIDQKVISSLPIRVFLWALQAFSSLQTFLSSKIVESDRFCQCDCCLGGETDSWCFLFYHLRRILFPRDYNLYSWFINLMWSGCFYPQGQCKDGRMLVHSLWLYILSLNMF